LGQIAFRENEISVWVIGSGKRSGYNRLIRYGKGRRGMYLETSRLILRDYEERDREDYYRLKTDKQTMYYLPDIGFASRQEADEEFRQVLTDAGRADRTFYFLHMELKSTHEQVGSIGYTVKARTPVGKIVHAGYFTYPKFWHNGYVTEAFRRVLEFAFAEDGVYRVTTGCFAENARSEQVMIKCGLIREAEHVDWEWHDGRMKTRLEYRMLRHEWKGQ
jgi:ribosomal-protein-alanine N-acetyltransferase